MLQSLDVLRPRCRAMLMSGARIQGVFGDRTAALGEHASVRQGALPIVAGSAMWPTHTRQRPSGR
jgi:hypothetical protein